MNEKNSMTGQRFSDLLVAYLPFFFIFIVLSLGASWLYLRVLAPLPRYEVEASVSWADFKTMHASGGAQTEGAPVSTKLLQMVLPQRSIDDDLEVLRSPELLARVVTELRLYAPVYREGRFRKRAAFDSSPLTVAVTDTSAITDLKPVPLVFEESMAVVAGIPYSTHKPVATPYGSLVFKINPYATSKRVKGNMQISLEASGNAGNYSFALVPVASVVSDLASRLSVDVVPPSDKIKISLTDENLCRGQAVLKSIFRNAYSLIREKNKRVSAFNVTAIDRDLTLVESTLLEIEQRVKQSANPSLPPAISRQLDTTRDLYTRLLEEKERSALSLISEASLQELLKKTSWNYTTIKSNPVIVYFIATLAGIFSWILFFALIILRANARLELRSSYAQAHIHPLLPVIHEPELRDYKHQPYLRLGTKVSDLTTKQFSSLLQGLFDPQARGSQKKILVTSAASRDGKMFIATNLAKSLAASGRRTVLLDFDLGSPFSLGGEHLSKIPGIAEYLKGEVKTVQSIIEPTGDKNLYMVSSGLVTKNTVDLLQNGLTERLLEELERLFDHLIINVAPVWPVSDACILSQLCDITLVIISHGYRPNVIVEKANSLFELRQLKNPAIVFNDVSRKRPFKGDWAYNFDSINEN